VATTDAPPITNKRMSESCSSLEILLKYKEKKRMTKNKYGGHHHRGVVGSGVVVVL
jgi:hypothetical protein